MKRKSFSKIIALALASAMVLGMTACGGDKTNAPAESGAAAPAQSSAAAPAGSKPADTPVARQTITWSLIDLNAGNNNVGDNAQEIMDKIQEYVGHDLAIEWVNNDALDEKNSLYLTNPKTMPQIMSWGGTVTGQIVQAAKDGAFVDLNQYIWDEAKYPNLSKMNKAIAANLTVNGQLIALPRTRVVGRYGLCYRKDWAEKLGVELPADNKATPDDVYKMLKAFTDGDPDGNGKNDTYGMEMCSYTGSFDIIQTWFGAGNGWAEVNGKLVPVWQQDEYFEAVDWIKKLYDEGIMKADWPSIPTDNWSNDTKTGQTGVYIDVMDSGKRIWNYFVAEDTKTPSVVNPNETASMVIYGAVNGHTYANAGYNGFFTLSASTLDTPEKIEAALTVLDKLNDREMLVLTQFGLEGINYKMNGDLVEKLDKEDEKLSGNYKGLNQLLCFLPSTEECTIPVAQTERDKAQNDAYAAALQYIVVNPALSFTVSSDAYAKDGKTLDEEAGSLRTQYICGKITKDDFKKGLDNLVTKGYDKIIEEVNAQYEANKKK